MECQNFKWRIITWKVITVLDNNNYVHAQKQ